MEDGKSGSEISGDWTYGGDFERASSSILNDLGWNLPLDDIDPPDRIIGSHGGHISSSASVGFPPRRPLDLTAADQEHPSPSARSTDAVSSSSSEDTAAEAPPSEKPPESTTAS